MTRAKADTIPPPAVPLDPTVLYMGDNGRLHCGRASCAGATAYATGIGLDGEPCVPVGRREIRVWSALYPEPIACEVCGLTATLDSAGHVVTERPSAPAPGDDEDQDVDVCVECGEIIPILGPHSCSNTAPKESP